MEVALGLGSILLEKYRVESVLGRGGMGIVLKVTHLQLGEDLALKLLLPEGALRPDVVARFMREAQSVVRLRGEHVARVSDIGMLPEGLPFIVMEYLHGVDLSRELKCKGMLPPGMAVDYVLQACEALAEAHSHGIIHRDIKPANLFLTTRPDGTPLIKVLDFGISKAPINASSLVTQTEVIMGTPGYMSPEQMKATKDVDARTDIWALGTVLYECLTGRRPFDGESFSAIVLMAGTEPPPPMSPSILRGLQAAVLRCLEKDRRARFPTIAEFVVALAPFARNQREATTIVERTSLMLQRPSRGDVLAAHSDQSSTITTLSGSAGSGLRPRRRRAITRGIWLFGCVGALFVAKLVLSGRLHPSSDEQPSIEPDSHETGPSKGSSPSSGIAATGHVDYQSLNAHAIVRGTSPPDASAVPNSTDADRALSAVTDGGDAGPDALMLSHAGDTGSVDAAPDASHSGSATDTNARPVRSTNKNPADVTLSPVPVPARPPPKAPVSRIPRDARNQAGVIVVRMKKTWAQVWIDEQEAGTTPVRVSVPAGIHKVLLVTDGHRDYVTVTVTGTGESLIERNW